jgi:hypothetical protein
MNTVPEIRAFRIVVPDAHGNPRIVLGLKDGDPSIELLDSQGDSRFSLSLEESEGGSCTMLNMSSSSRDGGGFVAIARDNFVAIEAVIIRQDDIHSAFLVELEEGEIPGVLEPRMLLRARRKLKWAIALPQSRPRLLAEAGIV